MNSLYTKALIFIAAIAVLVALVLGVMWMNNKTIEQAAQRSITAATETFAAERARDELQHRQDIARLEGKIAEANSDARARVAALDRAQRTANEQLYRRILATPDSEVGEATAAVLEESRNRWPS